MIKITKKEGGAALVEYGVLVGMIAVLSISAVLMLGTTVNETFDTVSEEVADVGIGETSSTPGASTEGSGAPATPASCQMIASGSGAVDAGADYAGVFCFEFPSDWDINDYVDSSSQSENFTFISGNNGMDYVAGSGNDIAIYAIDACVRTWGVVGTGTNEISVLNQASTDAYFMEDLFTGGTIIDFADGSGIILEGDISQVHFTDGSLSASEVTTRMANDPMAPDAGCPGGGGGMDMG